jgi:hypothetical protein
MTTMSVQDFLSGGGAPVAKFPNIGSIVKGTVEEAAVTQQTDFATGIPTTWDDGSPRMQLVVTLSTDERDDAINDDKGQRRVFIKGQMLTAVKDAVRAAGAKSLEVGGTLAVQYKSDGEPPKAGFHAPKIYAAQYKAGAAASISVDDLI